jgi:cytochrome c biogenesis protein CcdA
MNELWAVLVPILLTDILNPVLFAFLVYAAGTDRPVLNSSAMLLGHTSAYFGAGVLLAAGLDRIVDRLSNPARIDFVVELLLGVVLLALAVPSRKNTGKRPSEKTPALGVASSFGIGAVINFIGIPFAVPYFAALGQMMKADLTEAGTIGALAVYNLAYALPFTIVPISRAILGDRARPLLERINDVIERISGVLMPVLLGLVGLALLADGATFFLTGESLF